MIHLSTFLHCGDPGPVPMRPAPPPIIQQAVKLPKRDPLRFLVLYGALRIPRQGIQRAILMDPPRRFDQQWQTRTL